MELKLRSNQFQPSRSKNLSTFVDFINFLPIRLKFHEISSIDREITDPVRGRELDYLTPLPSVVNADRIAGITLTMSSLLPPLLLPT